MYSRYTKQLNYFHVRCLRSPLHVIRKEKVPDNEIFTTAEMQNVHVLQKLAQLRWALHKCRMPDDRLPKRLLFGEFKVGKESQGRQRKRYKDTLKVTLKSSSIDHSTWEEEAQKRSRRRSSVRPAVDQFEAEKDGK